jgi:hypothetical protein
VKPQAAKRPNVHRLVYLAVKEILADKNPADAAHREWLTQRLDAETRKVSSIPVRLHPYRPRSGGTR